MMADQRTMAQLLQAPTEGYEDVIVVSHGLLTLVRNKQYFRHDKEDPHAHIRYFNKITSTLKFPNVLNTSIKLMLFPFPPEGAAWIWLEKEPPRSIFTWDDLILKFINQFFPPSKTKNLRNEITNFQQRFDESFSEAWDRFKDLLRACPHHGFSKLYQLDTFYNALNLKDQDLLNSVAGVSTNTSTSGISPDVAELKDMVKALLLDKKSQNQAPATVKVVEESYFVNSNNASTSSSGTLPSNTIVNPRSDLKAITTRSGVSYDRPQIPPPPSFLPKVVENEPEATKDIVHPTNNGSTKDIQPQVVQSKYLILTSEPVNFLIIEPVISPVSTPRPNQRPSISYPSRMQDQKLRDKANDQRENFFQIFKDLNFNISFADALILMPNSPKEVAKNLGDPGKFLIPCDFPKTECLTLVDLGPSINLMPLFMWNKLYLPDLTPTCMALELADRLISRPVGVAEDVHVKVGELTLRVGKEAITFNLDQTSRYSANYNEIMAKRIDVIDMACEENSDFLLEEVDAFLALDDDPTSLEVDQSYLDPEGDILLLEAFLNDEPSSPPPNQGNYLPEVRKELTICEAKSDKSLIDKPPEVELKDLPPHLEYAFLVKDM
nr:hypothetical protein [Tanacetum cinerariifolium]